MHTGAAAAARMWQGDRQGRGRSEALARGMSDRCAPVSAPLGHEQNTPGDRVRAAFARPTRLWECAAVDQSMSLVSGVAISRPSIVSVPLACAGVNPTPCLSLSLLLSLYGASQARTQRKRCMSERQKTARRVFCFD